MRDQAGGREGRAEAGHREDLPRLPRERPRKPFDFAAAKAKIAHPNTPEPASVAVGKRTAMARNAAAGTSLDAQYGMAESKGAAWLRDELAPVYKNPVNLVFRPDGREVWAACEASGSVVVVDAAKRVKVAEIPVGGQATDLVFSPDGAKAYVDEPARRHGLRDRRRDAQGRAQAPGGRRAARDRRRPDRAKTLFVMGTAFDAVSVLDIATGKETKRLPASRNPWSVALSPGRHAAPRHERAVALRAVPHRAGVRGDGVRRRRASASRTGCAVPESNLLLGVAWHPSGEFALATLNRTKNLVPMTRILQGWTITNGLARPVEGRPRRPGAAGRAAALLRRRRRTSPSPPTATTGARHQRGHGPRGGDRRRRSSSRCCRGRPTRSAATCCRTGSAPRRSSSSPACR